MHARPSSPLDTLTTAPGDAVTLTTPESRVLDLVRRGDERAFTALIDAHTPALLRFARIYTDDAQLAEDAVQDTWVAFLRGLARFEGRASLRTWLCGILLNRLRSRVRQAARVIPFSRLGDAAASAEPAVSPDRFLPHDHAQWPGHWRTPPAEWSESPEDVVLAKEVRAVVQRTVAALPASQREVITLRDLEGWTAAEVCTVLGISDANQRVLLHRARSRVRNALERYFTEAER